MDTTISGDRQKGGKLALLSGADSGLGISITDSLQLHGWQVVGIARFEERNSQCNHTYVYDLDNAFGIFDLVCEIERNHGEIHALINNAGARLQRRFLETTPDELDKLFSINVRAAYFLSQAVAKAMIARHTSGSIVNISSQLGVVAGSDYSAYSVTKAALCAVTRALAAELARVKIAVNTIAPGPTNTAAVGLLKTEEEAIDFLMRIPLGRRVENFEVADAVRYLCELSGAAITGQTVVVDGGWTLI